MKSLAFASVFALCTAPVFASEAAIAMTDFARTQAAAWINDPTIINAIRAQNIDTANLSQGDIYGLDEEWRAEVGRNNQHMILEVMGNAASAHLRDHVAEAGGMITEVFVMDSRGLNVATSSVTSDYWQGDEAKFTETYPMGGDAVHVSDVEFDESTQSYQAQVSLSITDPTSGDPIGAVTFGINAQSFF